MLAENENLILKDRLTSKEIHELILNWDLDPSIFTHPDSPVEITRFITLDSSKLTNEHLLVTFNLQDINASIEQELVPVFTIIDQNHLFIGTTASFKGFNSKSTDPIDLIFENLLWQIHNLNQKLNEVKRRIDHLDRAARKTTKTRELTQITDLTRELVYLKHTLNDQTESLQRFEDYLEQTRWVSRARIESLLTEQLRLNKIIDVYTDLLTSISGLFTAMMDSHLNHLMKYLDSAALIIAIPALISGIWGMNIGGLPGKDTEYGFWILVLLSVILTISWGIFLKKKKYND